MIMRHFFTVTARYAAITLLVGTAGLGIDGCQDTGSIDPGPQLAALSVSGASLQPPFTSETTVYSVDLPGNAPDVTVSATKSDPNDVLSGAITAPAGQATGTTTIPSPGPGSTKDVSLTITSPDGRAKIYTITLRAIALGGGPQPQEFGRVAWDLVSLLLCRHSGLHRECGDCCRRSDRLGHQVRPTCRDIG